MIRCVFNAQELSRSFEHQTSSSKAYWLTWGERSIFDQNRRNFYPPDPQSAVFHLWWNDVLRSSVTTRELTYLMCANFHRVKAFVWWLLITSSQKASDWLNWGPAKGEFRPKKHDKFQNWGGSQVGRSFDDFGQNQPLPGINSWRLCFHQYFAPISFSRLKTILIHLHLMLWNRNIRVIFSVCLQQGAAGDSVLGTL